MREQLAIAALDLGRIELATVRPPSPPLLLVLWRKAR
jgi:hypothetical protein